MAYDVGDLETMVGALLAKGTTPTREDIREKINAVREGFAISSVSDDDVEDLAKQFEERHGVTMTIGAVLKAEDYEPWLPDRSSEIAPYYWERYRHLLDRKQFSGDVIATLSEVTDRITGLLEDPEKEGPWDRRGMVVGHVQSGKTANYTGLICKAADAGYKLIIVIAGINNNLRNQTQERIDEGFIGVDSSRLLSKKMNRYIGVGKYDRKKRPSSFTNTVRDFNKAMATGLGIPLDNLKEPAVFVIKKNTFTLKYLLEWLAEHNTTGSKSIDLPMLLIDDEADNASINIR
ncbi:MAG: endonuclease, partial [Chloroflexi bacterium]|nr:endonuclease [Chloroflexota bacterium]